MDVVSYHAAKAANLKRFFTGRPCKQGHLAERLVSNRGCLECGKIRLKKWQQDNPDKVRRLDMIRHLRDRDKRNELKRVYARKNVKAASERKRKWAVANRSRAWAIQKKWNDKNRHKINAYAANRRCLLANRRCLLNGSGGHTGDEIKEIYENQKGLCNGCGCFLGKWHVDHIVPISKGGSNGRDNLQLLCKKCNLRKGVKQMHEFLALLRIENGPSDRINKQSQ